MRMIEIAAFISVVWYGSNKANSMPECCGYYGDLYRHRSCLDNSRYGRARYDFIRDAGGISRQSAAFVSRQTPSAEDSKGARRPLALA
jgi:hypothetical protein